MERLTKRGYKKQALLIGTSCSYGYISYDCKLKEGNELLKSALDKLAGYEDLEEQGRLIKLPCNDVYFIVDINNPRYATVMKRPIRELAIYEIEDIDKENCKYFSTEGKAKARLKELRGGE